MTRWIIGAFRSRGAPARSMPLRVVRFLERVAIATPIPIERRGSMTSSQVEATEWVPDPNVGERLKRAVKRVFDLPSFPLVIRKLNEIAERRDSSSRDIARAMETDQGLSAKLLKLVNSAFYGFPKAVASLQHAITLLGFNTVRSLALSVAVKNLFQGTEGHFSQEHFWEHSLATALAARRLAELANREQKDDYFSAGLLHDMGILIEARYFSEELDKALASAAGGTPLVAAEERILGVNHCIFGAWLAEKWRLPATLREPMLRHHEFQDEVAAAARGDLDAEALDLVRAVTLANLISNGMGYTHSLRAASHSGVPRTDFEIPSHLAPLLAGSSLSDFVRDVTTSFQESKDFLAL